MPSLCAASLTAGSGHFQPVAASRSTRRHEERRGECGFDSAPAIRHSSHSPGGEREPSCSHHAGAAMREDSARPGQASALLGLTAQAERREAPFAGRAGEEHAAGRRRQEAALAAKACRRAATVLQGRRPHRDAIFHLHCRARLSICTSRASGACDLFDEGLGWSCWGAAQQPMRAGLQWPLLATLLAWPAQASSHRAWQVERRLVVA